MQWYWLAAIAGVIAPWFLAGRSIGAAFLTGGMRSGLGYWAGMATLTVPFMLLAVWVGVMFGSYSWAGGEIGLAERMWRSKSLGSR